MTRAQKLQRWADLVRATPGQLALYNGLEHHSVAELDRLCHTHTAFALAFADSTFREAGLKSGSVGDAKRFFELTTDELHAFSCNCGGAITNEKMADRISHIAAQSTGQNAGPPTAGPPTANTTASNMTATEVSNRLAAGFRSIFS